MPPRECSGPRQPLTPSAGVKLRSMKRHLTQSGSSHFRDITSLNNGIRGLANRRNSRKSLDALVGVEELRVLVEGEPIGHPCYIVTHDPFQPLIRNPLPDVRWQL